MKRHRSLLDTHDGVGAGVAAPAGDPVGASAAGIRSAKPANEGLTCTDTSCFHPYAPPSDHGGRANSTCNWPTYRGRLAHGYLRTLPRWRKTRRKVRAMPDIRPAMSSTTLVLNQTYEPLCVVSVRRATILLL